MPFSCNSVPAPTPDQLQNLRGTDGSGTQGDLTSGPHGLGCSALVPVNDADGPSALKDDTLDKALRAYFQISPLPLQVVRRTRAHAVAHGQLIHAHAFLNPTVEVISIGNSEFPPCGHEGMADLPGITHVADSHGAVFAVILARAMLLIFQPFKIGEHVVKTPARVSKLCPGIVTSA